MNVEKIHSLFLKIDNEFDSLKITESITQLLAALNQTIGNPAPPAAEAYKKALSNLATLLNDSVMNDLLPSESEMVEILNLKRFLGNTLLERIKTTIAENQIIPSVAVQEVTAISKEVEKFSKTISSTVRNFAALNVPKDVENEELIEIGMIIPREITSDSLSGLEKELHELNKVYRNLAEIAGQTDFEVKVKTISSTDYGLWVLAGKEVARLLTYIVEKSLDLYKKYQEIRINEAKLREQYPAELVEPLVAHTKSELDKKIAEIGDQVIVENYHGPQTRSHELNAAVTKIVKHILSRVDQGATIEIKIGKERPPADDEKAEGDSTTAKSQEELEKLKADKALFDELKEKAKLINSKLKTVSKLKSGTPIFLIEDGQNPPEQEK